jgi:hypothetical protein
MSLIVMDSLLRLKHPGGCSSSQEILQLMGLEEVLA